MDGGFYSDTRKVMPFANPKAEQRHQTRSTALAAQTLTTAAQTTATALKLVQPK